jgi:divalent metal cation (Fe/Co/Zn/Cd) transporter
MIQRTVLGETVIASLASSPKRLGDLRDRVLAAALAHPLVREAHDITILGHPEGALVSLHLKLPADLSLVDAHHIAERVERDIRSDPQVRDVQTHLEPLERPRATGPSTPPDEQTSARITQLVRTRTGQPPRDLRLLDTDAGRVVFLTIVAPQKTSLTDAHTLASRLEDDIRSAEAGIADVVVHAEPLLPDR